MLLFFFFSVFPFYYFSEPKIYFNKYERRLFNSYRNNGVLFTETTQTCYEAAVFTRYCV